ncbi:ligand-binding sensor domain-containing protein [Robertkochia solimangrovi]|uniref:ligand-binding sensor domain-containing protein n=1 Tax=Robertkochia solimangrovi TaxID=2213046 RepID=UPI0013A54673|nr:two-component regulator propeller domain-containing protein [Robertkochia solimangrovi]
MHKINCNVIVMVRLLGFVFLAIATFSCKGQETENVPVGSMEQKELSDTVAIQPLVYQKPRADTRHHSTLNGKVSEFIWQFFEDSLGNFWFGTNHDGIIMYDQKSLVNYRKVDGIGGNAVRAIKEDRDGGIWFGTSDGLTHFNGKEFINYTTKDDLINDEIWAVEIDPSGLLWIGTAGGVSKFNGKRFEDFMIPKPEVADARPMLSADRVSDILIDDTGKVWFVNDGYGITLYKDGRFEFLTAEYNLTDNNVADLYQDSRGDIWIGTFYGGVSKFNGETFRNFTSEGLLEGVEAYNFCEDRNGNIWFSAENFGVYRYDGERFTRFSIEDGLATNTIQSIYEDKKGQIWFSTWSGISLYDGEGISDVAEKVLWAR